MALDDLATKYRPQKWDDIVGHASIVRSLSAAVGAGRTHAFLLTGPSGVGKTTMARIIAREVGCDDHNILEIDAATFTSIDAMRSITSLMSYGTMGGSAARVIIVDEAHGLSRQAWQSLLKSVEEPGDHNFWVFCSTQRSKIPATIVNRCLDYKLGKVSDDDLHILLQRVCVGENAQLIGGPEGGTWDHAQISTQLVRAAGGSPRRLLMLLTECHAVRSESDFKILVGTVDIEEGGQPVELARALIANKSWSIIVEIVKGIKEPPETTRRVILAYLTRIVLGAKSEEKAGSTLELLDCFLESYDLSVGLAPLLISLGHARLKV